MTDCTNAMIYQMKKIVQSQVWHYFTLKKKSSKLLTSLFNLKLIFYFLFYFYFHYHNTTKSYFWHKFSLNPATHQSCTNDEYACSNGECIPQSAVCDNVTDCSDGEDEQECSCAHNEVSMYKIISALLRKYSKKNSLVSDSWLIVMRDW